MLRTGLLGFSWLTFLSCSAPPALPDPCEEPDATHGNYCPLDENGRPSVQTGEGDSSHNPFCTACAQDENGNVTLECYCESITGKCPTSIAEAIATTDTGDIELITCREQTFIVRESTFDAEFYGFFNGTLNSAGLWREWLFDCSSIATPHTPGEGCDEPCVVRHGGLAAPEGTCLSDEEIQAWDNDFGLKLIK